MPVRNEAAMIARSLGAVLAQDYPTGLVQILIADGDSEDHTRAVIVALAGAERVQVVRNPRAGASGGNECRARLRDGRRRRPR